MRRPGLRSAWSLLLVMLTGCASPLPPSLQQPLPQSPDLRAVLDDPERYRGQRVRWGGVIVSVLNLSSGSEIEVLARPLDSAGRPYASGPALGRFIARSADFVDPLVFTSNSELTLGGMLSAPLTRRIGDYTYTYPVVEVDALHLWAPRPVYRDPPYWYDPWYPWGYPYPWWRHPYHPYW